MLQNRIQNCKLFGFQGGRQDCTLCNLQSTSVLEGTGREERRAKIGLSDKFNKESKECFLQTFGLKKRTQLKFQNVVRCVPLDLQLKKLTSIGQKPKPLKSPQLGQSCRPVSQKNKRSLSNIFMRKARKLKKDILLPWLKVCQKIVYV